MLKRSPIAVSVCCVAITAATLILWKTSATHADVAGLHDFLTLRTKVQDTLAANLNNLPSGVEFLTENSWGTEIDPGNILIKEAMGRSGHWSCANTKSYSFRLDRSLVPGKYLPDVAQFVMDHFTRGLQSTDPDTYRVRNSLDTKYRPEKIANGLVRGISSRDGPTSDDDHTSHEEVWRSPQGVVNFIFRVDVEHNRRRDTTTATLSWYRFERY